MYRGQLIVAYICTVPIYDKKIKIIVSRYFRGLQIIFMDRAKASRIVADCLINFVIDVVYAMEFS